MQCDLKITDAFRSRASVNQLRLLLKGHGGLVGDRRRRQMEVVLPLLVFSSRFLLSVEKQSRDNELYRGFKNSATEGSAEGRRLSKCLIIYDRADVED